MNTIVKLSLTVAAIAVLTLVFLTTNSEPADAIAPCPTNHCPANLSGYTYVSPCANFEPACLGWIYTKNGSTCHVSAES